MSLLGLAAWATVVLGALWLALSLLERWRLKSYNLTRAERGGQAATPDFLKVDHSAREATIERGKRPPEPAAPPPGDPAPPRAKWSRLAGAAATLVAVLTLITASLKAITSVESYSAMAEDAGRLLTDGAYLSELISQYWPGLLVALAIIIVQVYKLVQTLKKA